MNGKAGELDGEREESKVDKRVENRKQTGRK
jgi:hypothetical protein